MTQPKKAQPDWERIEAAYRAGVMSLRELATVSYTHLTLPTIYSV